LARGSGKANEASDELTGWAILVVGLLCCGAMLWKNNVGPRHFHVPGMPFSEFNLFSMVVLLLPTLSLLLLLLKRELSEFGLAPCSREGVGFSIVGGLLFLPVLSVVGRTPQFQSYYLSWLGDSGALRFNKIDWGRLAYHESVMCLYMLAWEWFFRGFLTFGLKRIMPAWAAIGVQAALFCGLHYGKPTIELVSSFFGGAFLGWVALRYKSVLPCFLAHFILSCANDGAALYFHFNR
jgi:membrane protease YdiL (CAAX protease family)